MTLRVAFTSMSLDHFEELQRDPSVCNNCFRRMFDVEEINYVNQGTEIVPLRDSLEDVVADLREYQRNTQNVNRGVTKGRTMACECGSFFGSIQWNRPLCTSDLISYGQRLIKRLEEGRLPVDHDEFFDVLREMKGMPDEQFADDDIYREAVETSVQIDIQNDG